MQKDVYWSFGIGMVLAFLVSWALYKTAIMMVMLLVRMAADNPKKLHIKDDMKTKLEDTIVKGDMPEEDALWLNSIMERTFNEVRLSELPDRLGEQINNELQTKVNKIVSRLSVRSFSVGTRAPEFKGIHITPGEGSQKELNVFCHFFYIGRLSMVIDATINIAGASVNVSLSGEIEEITGRMRLQFYTTDQLYASVCFMEQPHLKIVFSVNDKNQDFVAQILRKSIRSVVAKSFVNPAVKIFPLQRSIKEDVNKARKKRQIVGQLLVHVVSASGLLAADRNGLSDPYCKVAVGRVEKKTRIIYRNLNPTWDQSFYFDVRNRDKEVKLRIYDWDKYSKDDFLGMLSIPITPLIEGERSMTVTKEVVSENRKREPGLSGTMTVNLSFLPSGEQQSLGTEDKLAVPENSNPHLSYVLGLIIVSATDLEAKDSNGFSDPYCKASVSNKTKSTPYINKTLNPIWQHKMTFEIQDLQDDLVLTLYDHDFGSADDFLGYARVQLASIPPNRIVEHTLKLMARRQEEDVTGSIFIKMVIEQIHNGTFSQWTSQFMSEKYTPPDVSLPAEADMGDDDDEDEEPKDWAFSDEEEFKEALSERPPSQTLLRPQGQRMDSDEISVVSRNTTMSSISSISSISDLKIHVVNDHHFRAKHYNSIKSCNVCNSKMLGVGKQGYQCRLCGYRCHKKCHTEATPCLSPASPF